MKQDRTITDWCDKWGKGSLQVLFTHKAKDDPCPWRIWIYGYGSPMSVMGRTFAAAAKKAEKFIRSKK